LSPPSRLSPPTSTLFPYTTLFRSANRAFVDGEQSFLILYADNLTNVDLGRMLRFHAQRDVPLTMGVAPTDKPKEKGTVRRRHARSEEHTSELQSLRHLVCRLLLEK